MFRFNKKEKKEEKNEDQNIGKYINVLAENIKLKDENSSLRSEVESLRKIRPVIDFRMGDPIPEKVQARKEYVAKVAEFHASILEPKIKHMISNADMLLETLENSPETDRIIKGTIHAFLELNVWGNAMINEYMANQEEIKEKNNKK